MSQYLKPDTELGYIEEQAEIENLKFNNARHTILGCMLGDFDETGAYVVSPGIVKELIEMPKYIIETMDNIEICKGVLKLDKQIAFMVTFEGNRATLSLIEKLNYEANFALNSGTYSNINEYVLDMVETSGEVNRNAIYLRWNIGDYEGETIDVFNCDPAVLEKYFGIVNRFKYLLKANQELLEKEVDLEEIEASYSNEILDILRRYPKLYTEVMAQIKTAFEEKENAITTEKPNFTKTFNELLENAIHSNIGVLSEEEIEEFNIERRNAIVNMNIKKSEVLELEGIENDSDGEFLNKTIRIKIAPAYASQSVDILGKGYTDAYKASINNLQAKKAGSNKSGLLDTLIQIGIVKAIQKQEIEAKKLVSTATEKVQAKQENKTAKKAAGPAKKPAPKSAAAKGKAPAKKPAANKDKKKDDKAKDKTKENLVAQAAKKKKKKKSSGVIITYGSSSDVLANSGASTERRVKRTHTVDVNKTNTEVKSKTGAVIDGSNKTEIGTGEVRVQKEATEIKTSEQPKPSTKNILNTMTANQAGANIPVDTNVPAGTKVPIGVNATAGKNVAKGINAQNGNSLNNKTLTVDTDMTLTQ